MLWVGCLHAREPHAVAKVTLGGGRRGEGAVRGEDAVVDEPGSGVELGVESLDAPAEAVLRVGDSLEDGSTDDRLDRKVSCCPSSSSMSRVTYNDGLLVGLTVARAESLPSHRGAVATVEDIESVEGNVGLFTVVGAEFLTRAEGDGIDYERTLATAVADDVDGGAVVLEVLGESLVGELEGVTLDELLEDVGDLGGVLVSEALLALVLALVPVPGTGVAPAPGTLRLPSARSRSGHGGRDERRSGGDESDSAHVDCWSWLLVRKGVGCLKRVKLGKLNVEGNALRLEDRVVGFERLLCDEEKTEQTT